MPMDLRSLEGFCGATFFRVASSQPAALAWPCAGVMCNKILTGSVFRLRLADFKFGVG